MKLLKAFAAAAALLLFCPGIKAQTADYDVFVPIAKYMAKGDVDALSTWFADNLEMTVISTGGNCSRNQAKQILKTFFESNTPRSFDVRYTAGRANMKYALGTLNAGGENFMVTIFVSSKGGTYTIQQIKIEQVR